MSIFSYNGVTLPYVLNTQCSQEAVGDESNTDWTYLKVDIKVVSYLNINYIDALLPDLTGDYNPAQMMKILRTRLMKRRRQISYTFNGQDLIPGLQGKNPGTVDARNGPIPQSCEITQLTDTTFIINYHIVAHYWENTDTAESPGGGNASLKNKSSANVINHRWSEIIELDEQQFTRKTRRGRWAIRSDNVQGVSVDGVRQLLVTLAPESGFLRESSRYIVDPTGLEVNYEITDKEQFKMPPFGTYKAQGTYTESYGPGGPGVGLRTGTVHVKLWGSKTSKQDDMYDAAMYLVLQKLVLNGWSQGNSKTPLTNVSVSGGMWENTIEMKASALLQGLDANSSVTAAYPFNVVPMPFVVPGGGAAPINSYIEAGSPLAQSIGRPVYNPRGTASMMLKAAAYYDPSLQNSQLILSEGARQTATGFVPGQAGLNKET